MIGEYLRRSVQYIKQQTKQAMDLKPRMVDRETLFRFNTKEELRQWIVGSDADIGGLSEAYWAHTTNNTALLYGRLSMELPPQSRIDKSGYVGIRSKEKPVVLFHRPVMDVSQFQYLQIRAKGDCHTWLVNLRTRSFLPSHVWQARLVFSTPGQWETVAIPFNDFVLTNKGFIVDVSQDGSILPFNKRRNTLDTASITTIGLSLLRQPGAFELELQSIEAVASHPSSIK